MESNMQDKKQQAVPQPKAESFAIKRNPAKGNLYPTHLFIRRRSFQTYGERSRCQKKDRTSY